MSMWPQCSRYATAALAAGVLALGTWVEAAPAPVTRGAEVGAPVLARSVDVDLRELPAAPEWQPGDPIREVPRRHTRPASDTIRAPKPQVDPLLAVQAGAPAAALDAFTSPLVNINGSGYTGVNPADPSGDVGPNHYIQAINQANGTRVMVYSKTGAVLAGPFTMSALGGGAKSCAKGYGDPIVLYDSLAGRWMMSEFASSGNHLCVYVSKTADPVSGGWWAYDFRTPSFPDYPKYGVWPDAYYVGTNESSSALYALDRASMLSGAAAAFQRFTVTDLSGFPFQEIPPADLDGPAPPAGAPMVFMRHKDSEAHGSPGAADTLELFEFHVDWATPANSTVTGPISINVAEFDSDLCGLSSFACIPQPGSTVKLDPLREVVMYRLQYRNRGAFESLVGNLATDVTGADRAGIRWFELRKSGAGPWTLYTEGTFSPDATNRWMGSAALDKDGNLALVYSVSAASGTYPGLRYTGRLAGDPLGTLTQGETTIVSGAAANASNRWGDYFHLSVDPSDDCTFWFTGGYAPATSWSTRIAAFKFDTCVAN